MTLEKIFKYDPDRKPDTLWNPCFITILALGFLTGTANQMVNPLISGYVVSIGGTLGLAGTVVGLMTGAAMILRPFSGAASDSFNRKHVMVGSVILTGIAFSGYLLFESIPAVVLCRVLQGFGFSFMSVSRTVFASDYVPEDRLGEGVSYTTFGVVFSQAIGPGIGLWISERFGYRYCFIIALVAQIIGLGMLALIPHKSRAHRSKRLKLRFEDLFSIRVIPLAVLAGLFSMSNYLVNAFLALIAQLRSITGAGIFFTVYAVISVIMRPVAGKILDRKGLAMMVVPALLATAISMILIGHAGGLPILLAAAVFKALGQGGGQPSLQAEAIRWIGQEKAGVAVATVSIFQDLFGFVAPTLGGFVVTAVGKVSLSKGYAVLFDGAGVLTLLGIVFYFVVVRSRGNPSKSASSSGNCC